jgi:hypothetical protein
MNPHTPAPQQKPWSPPPARPPRRKAWLPWAILAAAVAVAVALFVAQVVLAAGDTRTDRAAFDTTVTSCTIDDLSATVGFTVHNAGTRTRTATVDIEYRDAAGVRIDTDTSLVWDIAPGDTVRSQESTVLDTAPGPGATCRIVSVR